LEEKLKSSKTRKTKGISKQQASTIEDKELLQIEEETRVRQEDLRKNKLF
jgi:hypothetical protein